MLTADLGLARDYATVNPPPGRLALCGVTGAHIYGFPSPDSDLDLKGIHLAPTRQLLGLRPDRPAHDITSLFRGVECDLTTNEAGAALGLLVNGNGNMLERILSPLQLVTTDETAELQDMATPIAPHDASAAVPAPCRGKPGASQMSCIGSHPGWRLRWGRAAVVGCRARRVDR